jgi:hypothetical protein
MIDQIEEANVVGGVTQLCKKSIPAIGIGKL